MEPSIFTKIINGEIPCHKIYEDDKTFAFLDIHPLRPGHVLVVPREQIEYVWDLPNDLYIAVMQTSKKIAQRQREVFGGLVHERIVGTDVPHAHVQLVPFTADEDIIESQDMTSEPDHEALAAVAEKLRFE